MQLGLDDASKEYLNQNTPRPLQTQPLEKAMVLAQAIFERAMDQILANPEGVECYIHDIILTAPKAPGSIGESAREVGEVWGAAQECKV